MKKYDIDRLDNRDPKKIEEFTQFVDRYLVPYFRSEVTGLDRIKPGAGLYVGNHNAGPMTTDLWLFGAAIYNHHGMEAVPFGLGHEVVIQWPIVNQLVAPLGAVRASHANAQRVFEAGKKVMVYPGGDIDAMRPFRKRGKIVFGGRRGYIRLALKNNAPITPVVSSGSHSNFVVLDDMRWMAKALKFDKLFRLKVFPFVFSVPWGLTFGFSLPYIPLPTRILIEIMEPIHFDRSGHAAAADDAYVRRCADYVETKMQETLTRLEYKRRQMG